MCQTEAIGSLSSSEQDNNEMQSVGNQLSRRRSKRPNHTQATMSSSSRRNLRLLVSAVLSMLELVGGQCPVHTMTSFERISNVQVNPNLLKVLYTAQNITLPINPAIHHLLSSSGGGGSERHNSAAQMTMTIPITAECNNRCRRESSCRAFLVDYARHVCYSVNAGQGSMRNPTPITLLPTQDRTSYFEKICLNLPAIDCERAWIFERVLSHQLYGHDDKIIDDVPSRLRCQEHCLNEREFRCRSGEYDYLQQQCRLSMFDRHAKSSSFRASAANVDYFENQCVSVGNQCDAFDRFEDLDLGRAEIMRSANTSDQCQLFCTQTIKAFVCRSFTWNPMTGKCYLNSANTFTVGGLDKLISAPGLIYYQRNDCVDLKLECDTNAMTLQLRTNEPFRGRMYVRDEPNLCETLGRSSLSSSLSIPFNHHAISHGADALSASGRSCATRELPSRYSSVVVVQQHPLIQRKSDRYIKVVCDFQTANKTISSSYNVVNNPWTSTALINATSFAPKIRLRITDQAGNDITGAKLGDTLYLRIEAESESVYDMVARSVLAKSGTSEESIALIDKDGCPTDYRIFPPLKKLNRRTIVGKFDAFKFSSDVVVRFQVDVQFCLNQCPPPICDQQQQQQLLLNAPPQLPSSSDLGGGGVETYSAGSLRPSTTLNPSTTLQQDQQQQMSSTSTTVPGTSSSTTMPSTDDELLLQTNQQASDAAATVPSSSSSSQTHTQGSYPLMDSSGGLRMPANMLGQTMYTQAADQYPAKHHHPNGHQQATISASQLHNLMSAQQGDSQTTSDPQIFDPSMARAKSSDSSSQQQQQANNKRQRRSVETIPATPRHVPLQREIIVESSAATSADKSADSKSSKSSGQPTATASTTDGRTARTKTSLDFAVSSGSSSKANGLIRNASGPAYDTLATEPVIRGLLPRPESLIQSAVSATTTTGNKLDNDNNNNNRPLGADKSSQADEPTVDSSLLCTTKQSLVLASLAFSFIQLLSLGLCLVTWLHKRRDGIFKVGAGQQAAQRQPFNQHQQHHSAQRFF